MNKKFVLYQNLHCPIDEGTCCELKMHWLMVTKTFITLKKIIIIVISFFGHSLVVSRKVNHKC